MKTTTHSLLVALLAVLAGDIHLYAQGTAFTYQGRLSDGGNAAQGNYDLQFSLKDAATAGNTVGSAMTRAPVGVTNGLFAVTLDYGAVAFNGASRWLEISVRTNGSATAYWTLAPRQLITSAPYAIQAASAAVATSAATATTASSVAAANITGSLQWPQMPGGVLTNNASGVTLSGIFNGASALSWRVVTGTVQQAAAQTGYIATNDTAQVAITLPAAPNAGDVVRISGAGASGWKVTQNPGQSVLGVSLGMIAVDWTAHESNRFWWSIASSADGSKLVAGVNGGLIYTSTDAGGNWTPRETSRSWISVASSADGSKLAAVDYNVNKIFTSADAGATWTQHESNRQWYAIASSADGNKLAAVVRSGQIYTSTDGGDIWTPRESNRAWQALASSADGSKLAAVVFNGQIYTSTNAGATWTPRENFRSWQTVASSSDGSRLIAGVDGGQLYTSSDSGVSWLARESSRQWHCVTSSADGSKLFAADYTGQLYTSVDWGALWTPRENNRTWQTVACSADGSKVFAGVSGGQIYTALATIGTTPGAAGYLIGGQFTTIELQYIGNGQFLPLSHEGTVVGY